MSNPQPMLSLANVVVELQRLCQQKLSGTLFISADNHRMAQVSLLDGNIVALSCLNKRGTEALPLIQQLNLCWFQFINGTSISVDRQLPPTTDIVSSLASTAPAPATSETKSNRAIGVLPQQIHKVLKETLAEFMGPVAQMICNKLLQQPRTLSSAIDLLAQEIPDRQQALKFKVQVKQKLL